MAPELEKRLIGHLLRDRFAADEAQDVAEGPGGVAGEEGAERRLVPARDPLHLLPVLAVRHGSSAVPIGLTR